MAKVEIIGAPQSTYVRVVRMVCEEKGVPYELTPAAPHSPPINAIHPLGKMPVMRHGDIELCESKAIATYLDRAFGGAKLLPDDPYAAAKVEQWISMINTAIDPVMIRAYVLAYVFPKGADGKPDRNAIEGAMPPLQKQMDVLDSALASNGHFVGSDFTLADINLMPILFYVQKFPEGEASFKAARNVAAFYDRHSRRPSFQNTMPPPPQG